METAFRAEAARVNITPPVGVTLSGFGSRAEVSNAIDDELYAKALVLDDGDTKIALITTDLIGVPPEVTAQVRELVRDATGIPPENTLLCCSHTHFGPALAYASYLPEVTRKGILPSYMDTLAHTLAGAVSLAHGSLRPARVGWGVGAAPELVLNRRTRTPDGKVQMSWLMPSPEEAANLTFGPVDPDVGVLRVEGTDGELIAALINFACHPTSGTDRMLAISADYPAYAMRVVEQVEGGVCLFALGCAAQLVAIQRQGRSRRWIGTALGAEALRVLQRVPMRDNARLRAVRETATLPLRPDAEGDDRPKREEGGGASEVQTEMQALVIGDLVLLGLPGEVFVEIGLALKEHLQGAESSPKVFVLSLSNDELNYVCLEEAWEQGGYEQSFTPLARGSGEILLDAAKRLLDVIL